MGNYVRYTERDDCGNAHLIHDKQDENTARAFLNHVAKLEDWYDALLKDGANISVLHCKNCKYWEDNSSYIGAEMCTMDGRCVNADDYCSWAERK